MRARYLLTLLARWQFPPPPLEQNFIARFPAYNRSALFIAGESYAGVYVPMFAQAILATPAAANVNLQGILVGNGAVATGDWYEAILVQQRMEHAFAHGLFSAPLKAQIDAACTDYVNPSAACSAALQTMSQQMGPLNAYDIEETCLGYSAQAARLSLSASGGSAAAVGVRAVGLSTDPCSAPNDALTTYLNRADVQAAMHVAAGATAVGAWSECQSGTVNYTRMPQDERQTVYPGLLQKIAVLIFKCVLETRSEDARRAHMRRPLPPPYPPPPPCPLPSSLHLSFSPILSLPRSGDQDECIPYAQDTNWTRAMGFPVATGGEWQPWILDNQVAGYVTEFAAPVRFTFATVKRAGVSSFVRETPVSGPAA